MAFVKDRPLVRREDAAYFTGRDREVKATLEALNRGFDTLVIGDRGAGKTSFLHQLSRLIQEHRVHQTFFVTAPASGDGATLAEAIAEQVIGPVTRTVGRFDRMLTATTGDTEAHPTSRGRKLAAIDRLAANIERERFRGGDSEGPYFDDGADFVVLVDNAPAKAVESFFHSMRDSIARLPVQWIVAVDNTGSGPLLHTGPGSFFDVLVRLDPLDPPDARELLLQRLGATPPADVIEAVLATTSTNPRALVATAARLSVDGWDGETVRLKKHAEAMARVTALGRSAATLVAELQAQGPASASSEGLLAALGWSRPRASEVFGLLEQHGLVIAAQDKPDGSGRPRKVYALIEELR
jgi:hypothetical protein